MVEKEKVSIIRKSIGINKCVQLSMIGRSQLKLNLSILNYTYKIVKLEKKR